MMTMFGSFAEAGPINAIVAKARDRIIVPPPLSLNQ
jgi:hypothetical protein